MCVCYICDNYICLVHGYTHTFLIPFFIFQVFYKICEEARLGLVLVTGGCYL